MKKIIEFLKENGTEYRSVSLVKPYHSGAVIHIITMMVLQSGELQSDLIMN